MRNLTLSLTLILAVALVTAGSAQGAIVYDLANNAGAYDYGTGAVIETTPGGPRTGIYTPGADFTVKSGYAAISPAGGLRIMDWDPNLALPGSDIVGPFVATHANQTALAMLIENHVANEATGVFRNNNLQAFVFGYKDPMNYYFIEGMNTAALSTPTAGGTAEWRQVKVWQIINGAVQITGAGLQGYGAAISGTDILSLHVDINGNVATITETRTNAAGVPYANLNGVSFTFTAPESLEGRHFGFTTRHNNGNYMDIVSLTVVPEPATMGLLVMGAAGMLARRRRR